MKVVRAVVFDLGGVLIDWDPRYLYRKLFDGRAAIPTMTPDEMLSLCANIRSYHDRGMMGALAIVATPEQTMLFARLLGALASAKRPIKMFENPRQARNWIEDVA